MMIVCTIYKLLHVSHFFPEQPDLQEQLPLEQVPPFWHGFGLHGSLQKCYQYKAIIIFLLKLMKIYLSIVQMFALIYIPHFSQYFPEHPCLHPEQVPFVHLPPF